MASNTRGLAPMCTAVATPSAQFNLNPAAPEFFPGVPSSAKQTLTLFEAIPQSTEESTTRPRAETDSQLIYKDRTVKLKRASTSRRSTSDAATPVVTLVIKNLALNLTEKELKEFLDSKGAKVPHEVEFHTDSSGTFRGTAFVRYTTHEEAKASLEALGNSPELSGRKARVEFQKAKGRDGRSSLEAELPLPEITLVQEKIQQFLDDDAKEEEKLPAAFNVQQRKYAHSLAERHHLVHITKQGETEGEKYVYLSKQRADKGSDRNTLRKYSEGMTPQGSPWYSPAYSPTLTFSGESPCSGRFYLGSASTVSLVEEPGEEGPLRLPVPKKVGSESSTSKAQCPVQVPRGPAVDGSRGFTRPRTICAPLLSDPAFNGRFAGMLEASSVMGAQGSGPPGLELEA